MVHCFVPECISGYPSQRKLFRKLGKRIPSMFACKPTDVEKWDRAIPRADRKFSVNDSVCELHFNEDDIERCYSHKFPDGTIQVLERGRPLLKPNCVPTIFPKLPDRFSKKSLKRKSAVERVSATKKIKLIRGRPLLKPDCVPTIFPNLPDGFSRKSLKRKSPVKRVSATKKITEEDNSLAVISTTTDDAERQVDEFNLSNNIQLVKLPNQWWTIHSFPNYVACARWNENFLLDRRVVIKNDNSIKVSLYDIDLRTKEKVSCIQDVSFLLQKVDDYTPCSNATNKFFFYLNLHESDEHIL